MSLRADAIAAWQQAESQRDSDARAVLASTLSPEDVSGLTVADSRVTDAFVLFVFTDGDLNLAVRLRDTGNDVHLVTGRPGNWTNQATITSLEQLGEVLSA